MSAWLTAAEVGELTALKRWSAQRRALQEMGIPFTPNRAGRPLVVSEDGAALSKSALNSAWRRAMAAAIKAGLISADSRFGLHGLKHRGITDTPGRKADKKAASGHKTDAMLDLYDHALQVVDAAGKRD